jgi:hypothetical protein
MERLELSASLPKQMKYSTVEDMDVQACPGPCSDPMYVCTPCTKITAQPTAENTPPFVASYAGVVILELEYAQKLFFSTNLAAV